MPVSSNVRPRKSRLVPRRPCNSRAKFRTLSFCRLEEQRAKVHFTESGPRPKDDYDCRPRPFDSSIQRLLTTGISMTLKQVLLAGLMSSCFSTSQAAVLTFDDLGTRQGSFLRAIGQSYTADGFQLQASGPNYAPNAQFYVFDAGRAEWTGSPGLTLFAVSGRIELKSVNNVAFNLSSIDISRGDTNLGLIPVGFTGYRANGTAVQATYHFIDQIRGRNETFSFGAEFSELTSVVWYQGAEWHQFDNIHVSTVSNVPEPATITLWLIALTAGASTVRRTNRVA